MHRDLLIRVRSIIAALSLAALVLATTAGAVLADSGGGPFPK
jgi:hypothetical protein